MRAFSKCTTIETRKFYDFDGTSIGMTWPDGATNQLYEKAKFKKSRTYVAPKQTGILWEILEQPGNHHPISKPFLCNI